MAKIANVASTDTFNTWRLRSNESFDRLSQFAINNSALYANNITANVTFTSKGLATFEGRATVGTNLDVSGNTSTNKLSVTADISASSANASFNKITAVSSLVSSGNTILGSSIDDVVTINANNIVLSANLDIGSNRLVIDYGNERIGINTLNPRATLDISGTDGFYIPSGNNSQRPVSPQTGMIRFNTESGSTEYYDGSSWKSLGASAGATADFVYFMAS